MLTFLMSRPRWATSVATSTLALPCLKAQRAWSRSRCSMSPWRQTMGAPARESVECMLAAARLVFVKISAAPPEFCRVGKISSSRCFIFSLSLRIFTMCCVMSAFVVCASELPTWMCVGVCVKDSATCLTSFGHVAVKSAVWRCCGRYLTSSRICGSKPMSSMRSASSSTSLLMLSSRTCLPSRKSFSLPGVAMRQWHPLRMADSCMCFGDPP
mmetsp:Transcript_108158/g.349153  ORF Transcript_108158/g.349153 Transcript_108158/m.349153 type:complete len:213 (+) Transcript_108158:345-983(+)